VKDASPLANLSNLEHLFLEGTQVGDLLPLVSLVSMKNLHIEDTPVTDEQISEFKRTHPHCTIAR